MAGTRRPGRGVYYGIREACADADDMRRLGLFSGLDGKTVAIQGLGNVGYHATGFLQEGGATVVGLAEYEGAIQEPKGLDVDEVVLHRNETGSTLGFPGSRDLVDTREVLELECDILIPAALENQITTENAGRIRAKMIGEAANGAVTADADEILTARGVMVIPDI